MSKDKQLEQLIEKTRPQFNEKNIVAFIGEVSSGKTVVSALLKYTLSTSWIPKSNGKWEAVSSSGYDEINEIIREMKKGVFPSPTPKKNYPKLVIDVHNMEGKPVKIELILHDMSGENYASLLSKPYTNEEDRLIDILSTDGAYLAYAKKYVILINCENKSQWDTDPSNAAPMLSSIRKIKQLIHHTNSDEKIHSSIAIVFTKSDRLSPQDIKKTPEELMKDYTELQSSLNINYDRASLGLFKVFVDSKMETKKEADERVKKEEEKMKKEVESKTNALKQQIDAAVEQAVSAVEKQARAAGQPPDQIQLLIENTRKQTLAQYDEQLKQELPKLEKSDPIWKINDPFKYSESEYSKFISWILETKHDK